MAFEQIDFPGTDGNPIPGWLFRPKGKSGIGVCMVHDVFGLRADYEDVVAPFVEHGYVVLLPDMFYQTEPLYDVDEKGNKKKHYRGLFKTEEGMVTLKAAVQKLKGMSETGGRVGVTGYCLGGTLSYLAAARLDEVGASAGYYATNVHGYLDEAKNIRHPLYLHIPETDRTHTPEDAERVRQTLKDIPQATCFIYPKCVHGFANNEHPGYNAEMTRLANQRTFDLFDRIK